LSLTDLVDARRGWPHPIPESSEFDGKARQRTVVGAEGRRMTRHGELRMSRIRRAMSRIVSHLLNGHTSTFMLVMPGLTPPKSSPQTPGRWGDVVGTVRGRRSRPDERLPLRWGVILAVAAGAGLGLGMWGGPAAGVVVSIAVVGLLFQILGN
jgi:hypothetical protein